VDVSWAGLPSPRYKGSIAKKSQDVLGTWFNTRASSAKAVLDGALWRTVGVGYESAMPVQTRVSGPLVAQEPPKDSAFEAVAQRSADRLALALEDVGFDVGRAFPLLQSGVDRDGTPIVELGRVTEEVASRLSTVLSRAAQRGVTLPID
jgi:hypothetical protein